MMAASRVFGFSRWGIDGVCTISVRPLSYLRGWSPRFKGRI